MRRETGGITQLVECLLSVMVDNDRSSTCQDLESLWKQDWVNEMGWPALNEGASSYRLREQKRAK